IKNVATPIRMKGSGDRGRIAKKTGNELVMNVVSQVLISLEEPANLDKDDASFSSFLILKSSDNESDVDLLKITGTRDKANLYVRTLIQVMYTMEELAALQPTDTYSDNRYKLIQEALCSKFKLSDDQLEQIFNEWLREVFLAKWRVAVAKIKPMKHNE
ncbi:unnamed protein product, partial [Rotaria socialis]